jgi:hypothetical protein
VPHLSAQGARCGAGRSGSDLAAFPQRPQMCGRRGSGCLRCQRDAAPDAQRAWRAPCLTRPGQVTMRAVVNVLARASLELNYPFWMGDRRVGTWWTCEVIPGATNETHGRAGVISGTVDRAIRIRRPGLSLLPFLPSIRDVEKVPPMRDVADDQRIRRVARRVVRHYGRVGPRPALAFEGVVGRTDAL